MGCAAKRRKAVAGRREPAICLPHRAAEGTQQRGHASRKALRTRRLGPREPARKLEMENRPACRAPRGRKSAVRPEPGCSKQAGSVWVRENARVRNGWRRKQARDDRKEERPCGRRRSHAPTSPRPFHASCAGDCEGWRWRVVDTGNRRKEREPKTCGSRVQKRAAMPSGRSRKNAPPSVPPHAEMPLAPTCPDVIEKIGRGERI